MVRGLVRLPRLLAISKAPQVSRPWASCGYHQQHSGDGEGSQFNPSNFWGPAAAAAVGIGAAILWKNSERRKLLAEELKVSRVELGVRKEGLPEFSMEEVSSQDSHVEYRYSVSKVGRNSSTEGGGRVWVTYKDGVYDITDFIPLHPGATKLLMAAGGSVEPFWAMYAVHLNNAQVAGLLEQYRWCSWFSTEKIRHSTIWVSGLGTSVPWTRRPRPKSSQHQTAPSQATSL